MVRLRAYTPLRHHTWLAHPKVLLKGVVTSVDSTTGTLTIGKQLVDYTNLLADENPSYSVGTVLTIVGTQPVLNGTVVADEIR